MAVRAHHPEDLHARRPVGRPGVLDPEVAGPAQGAHEVRRRREARHAGQREAVAAAVDLADASDIVVMMIIMVVVLMASPTARAPGNYLFECPGSAGSAPEEKKRGEIF